jgi:predicted nucleic acid-binding protein
VILVDTSVWVDHLRRGNAALVARLDVGLVVTHSFVLGELALGSLKNRSEVIELLSTLPRTPTASDGEVMLAIEQRRLWSGGIGWVDAHLLVSAMLHRLELWTLDRRLSTLARKLGVAVT